MIILSSPAKTFSEKQEFPKSVYTKPKFIQKASKLNSFLKNKDPKELESILQVSSKLADLNLKRFQKWSKNHNLDINNSKPVLYSYYGDVFRELETEKYSMQELDYAQKSLFVISGFYGILNALNLIQEYRLEMKLSVTGFGGLKDLWKQDITNYLNQEIDSGEHLFIINAASKEYSDAVDFDALKIPVYDAVFKERKNGKEKIIGIFAKKARGKFINYCIKHHVETLDQVKNFKTDGYNFKHQEGNKLIFVRG